MRYMSRATVWVGLTLPLSCTAVPRAFEAESRVDAGGRSDDDAISDDDDTADDDGSDDDTADDDVPADDDDDVSDDDVPADDDDVSDDDTSKDRDAGMDDDVPADDDDDVVSEDAGMDDDVPADDDDVPNDDDVPDDDVVSEDAGMDDDIPADDDVPPDACTNQPCSNDGTCIVEGAGYTCDCPNNFTGTHCEQQVLRDLVVDGHDCSMVSLSTDGRSGTAICSGATPSSYFYRDGEFSAIPHDGSFMPRILSDGTEAIAMNFVPNPRWSLYDSDGQLTREWATIQAVGTMGDVNGDGTLAVSFGGKTLYGWMSGEPWRQVDASALGAFGYLYVLAMSGNGLVTIGYTRVEGLDGYERGFRWTTSTLEYLGPASATSSMQPYEVSVDGAVIVGTWEEQDVPRAFAWTTSAGAQYLSGSCPEAHAVSADGRRIAGACLFDGVLGPALWDDGVGPISVVELLAERNLDLEGRALVDYSNMVISGDGSVLAGVDPDGKGWVVDLGSGP